MNIPGKLNKTLLWHSLPLTSSLGSLVFPIVLIAPIASSLALSKLSESQETLGDEVDFPASFDSISLQQMVAALLAYIAATGGEWGEGMLRVARL